MEQLECALDFIGNEPVITGTDINCISLMWNWRSDQTDDGALKAAYSKSCDEYHQATSERRKESWKEFVKTSMEDNLYGFVYKMFNEKISPSQMNNIQRPDGTYTSNWTETSDAPLDNFFGSEDPLEEPQNDRQPTEGDGTI
ncbi:hypothetical protein QAD02_010483 [Eretmocerus hayati]|uniref:Uncharacterized protein n=1 Tax=Eretmocerus hayati TaxID=131215 RepID=A0ACC2NWV8_9HYME|nr:hypothetical protein QAD02_010483 [Eretmocerus hayati]